MYNQEILVLRDNAKNQLLQIKTVEDGISYMNKLKTIDVWIRAEKKDAELQNIIAEQKIRTQRILGELIEDGQRNGEIRKQNDGPVLSTGKELNEIGVNKKQSSSWQQIASIPEQTFEEFILQGKDKVNEAVRELTTAGAVRLAKSLTNKNKHHECAKTNDDLEREVKELLCKINSLPPYYRFKIKQGIRRGK